MKIWLFNPYGQIPGEGWRDYRFTMLGKALAERGHEVIWWTANFSHTFKSFRAPTWADIPISSGFLIRLVPTTQYRRNISLRRIRFELNYARNAYRGAIKASAPDCIIATDPSQVVGFLGVHLSKAFKVPLIIDVFDLWPELFTLTLPKILRPFAVPIFSPFYLLRRYNLRRADALVSLCQTYLDAAAKELTKARPVPKLTVFNGIDLEESRLGMPTKEEVLQAAARMGKTANAVWAVYTGTLGNNYDVKTLIDASLILKTKEPNITILVLGEGPLRQDITSFIAQNSTANIRYLGTSLKPKELLLLYKVCDIALCAYSTDSNVAMPNKAYDYLAAGMPIVNSLRGELESFLSANEAGIPYVAGDPESLVSALQCLAAAPDQRQRLAKNAYEKAVTFDSRILYEKYSVFVEGIGGNSHSTLASGPTGCDPVRFATEADVQEMVEIHLRAFPGFFLSILGPRFLKELYQGIIEDETGVALVFAINGRIQGFVVGSLLSAGLYSRLLRQRWFRFSWASLSAVLRHPEIVLRLMRAINRPAAERANSSGSALMSLAVTPEEQGKGIGSRLVKSFCMVCADRGSQKVKLTTDSNNNASVNLFYQRMGFQSVRTFTTPEGRKMNEYLRDVSSGVFSTKAN